MKINAFAKTDIGTFRKINQDSYLCLESKTGEFLAAVCDGLGGHKCGEIASSMAIEILNKNFTLADWNVINNNEKIYFWLKQTISQIQQEMEQYSYKHQEASDMGTTLVLVLFANKKTYFVNIGDSRIYYFYQDKLLQLTTDHNLKNLYLQKDNPQTTGIEIDKTYWKALTSALGPIKSLKVDIFDHKYEPPFSLLLTSDGVHDFLDEWEITHILEKRVSNKAKVKLLIKTAINNVSTDNLTVILIEFK